MLSNCSAPTPPRYLEILIGPKPNKLKSVVSTLYLLILRLILYNKVLEILSHSHKSQQTKNQKYKNKKQTRVMSHPIHIYNKPTHPLPFRQHSSQATPNN